jgi:hypothetical protein
VDVKTGLTVIRNLLLNGVKSIFQYFSGVSKLELDIAQACLEDEAELDFMGNDNSLYETDENLSIVSSNEKLKIEDFNS